MKVLRLAMVFAVACVMACGGCDDDGKNDNSNPNGGLDPCAGLGCAADSRCVIEAGAAMCECRPGFTGDGQTCEEVIVNCDTADTCDSNAQCLDGRCRCNDGWEGDGATCTDVDECGFGEANCDDNATCTNTEGTYSCSCMTGFDGDGTTCEPVDFCEAQLDDCDAPNSECSSVPGGFECICSAGYTGDGQTCSILADCQNDASACDENATCENTPDGTACVCDTGYSGDGATCQISGFESIVAGGQATCGLRRDKTMWCWGFAPPDGPQGGLLYDLIQPIPVAESFGFGWNHLDSTWTAVRDDGSLWQRAGTGGWQQIGADSDWAKISGAVTQFRGFSCGLKTNGERWCWGENRNGQLGNGTTDEVMAPERSDDQLWSDVTISAEHACGIKTDGTLWCWGENIRGELGTGSSSPSRSASPLQVGSDNDWEKVIGRRGYALGTTCAQKTSGEIFCWGGILREETPTSIGGLWSDFSLGSGHECGVKSDGSLWCRGGNLWGERGDDEHIANTTFRPVGNDSDWKSVSAGAEHTCALKQNGDTYCFGHNYFGELGIGTFGVRTSPERVASTNRYSMVSMGQAHTCAATTGGSLECTGSNIAGHAGFDRTTVHEQVFTPISNGGGITDISGAIQHTCGVKSDGTLWCMGFNGGGQLGLGEGVFPMTVGPVRVGSQTDWEDVTTGPTWGCGLRSNGTIWCWGTNDGGQLGTGDVEWRYTPVQVGTDTDWRSVNTGGQGAQAGATCGIKTDGSLWCWGQDWIDFQTTEDTLVPEQVGTDTDWALIDIGAGYRCGIKVGGTLWCWGLPGAGRVGHTNTMDTVTPTQVGTDSTWVEVATGQTTTCGRKDNGTLWCWGDGTLGQLGNGSAGQNTSQTPIQVGSKTDWSQVAVGSTGTCAIDAGGVLYCWGTDRDGQLGHGDAWYTSPQKVRD